LYGPQASASSFHAGAALEPQWCQSGLNAPFDWRPGLREGHRNFRHAYMLKFRMSSTDIFAQSCHRSAKIKMLGHACLSPDPSEVR